MQHGQTIGSALDGPTAADSGRFVGADASGCVRVQLDPDVARPRVALGAGWRSTVRPEGLGAAVLQAFGAATTERLMAFASADPRATATGPTTSSPGGGAAGALPTGISGVELVHRAQGDLAEYRTRLAALSAATRTVSSSDQRVTATVRGGSTLDGCPYLLALLATNPAAMPFTLPGASAPPVAVPSVPGPPAGLDPQADPDRPVWSPPAGWNPTSAAPAGRPSRPAADPTNADW